MAIQLKFEKPNNRVNYDYAHVSMDLHWNIGGNGAKYIVLPMCKPPRPHAGNHAYTAQPFPFQFYVLIFKTARIKNIIIYTGIVKY